MTKIPVHLGLLGFAAVFGNRCGPVPPDTDRDAGRSFDAHQDLAESGADGPSEVQALVDAHPDAGVQPSDTPPVVPTRPLFVLNAPSQASQGDDSIVCFDSDGVPRLFLPPDSTLNGLVSMDFSPDGERLYVVQIVPPRLIALDRTGAVVDIEPFDESADLRSIVATEDGLLHVLQGSPARMININPVTRERSEISLGDSSSFAPLQAAHDQTDTIYITGEDVETTARTILKVDPAGAVTTFFADGVQLDRWDGITYDQSTGKLWSVGGISRTKVYRFDLNGSMDLYATLFAELGHGIVVNETGAPLITFRNGAGVYGVKSGDGNVHLVYDTGLIKPEDIKYAPTSFSCRTGVRPTGQCGYVDSVPCSGHGACTNGLCVCHDLYAGNLCNECIPGHKNYPECQCNDERHSGIACDQCADHRTGYPTCPTSTCREGDPCCGHGTLSGQTASACICDPGYTGTQCDVCSYNEPYPDPFYTTECCPTNCGDITMRKCIQGACTCMVPPKLCVY